MKTLSPYQVVAASAVVAQFARETKGTASETLTDKVVYSIGSILGYAGQPSQEFADSIAAATNDESRIRPMTRALENGDIEIIDENPLGLPVGAIFSVTAPEDEEPKPIELPDEAFLNRLSKDDLVAQVNLELRDTDYDEVTRDTGTVAELVESLLYFRDNGIWPEDDPEEGEDENANDESETENKSVDV